MAAANPRMVSHFRIVEKLGEGGMGVVWKAIDTRLGREVAIKSLPESFADDEERLARFEREARALASLSHPNIASIFGLEQPGDASAPVLVLEYVPGKGLDECLEKGALPLDDALDVAQQLAAGLEAAHELGVVHRDLKPANIRLTPDDRVKILDFGLAKVFNVPGVTSAGASDDSPTVLLEGPTHTAEPTRVGSFLGTVGYMSPEQARGKPVDKRADIWAFGCILFECLAGRPPFPGDSAAEKLGAILHLEPQWDALPHATPAAIVELLHRCLEKDPKRRTRDIGDARNEVDRVRTGLSSPGRALDALRAVRRRTPIALPLALGALLLVVVLWNTFGGGAWRRTPDRREPIRLTLAVPPNLRLMDGAMAPDGRSAVLSLRPANAPESDNRAQRLYVRTLDSFELRPLPGTEGTLGVVFFPDGKTVAFVARESSESPRFRLARLPVDGSAPPVPIREWDPTWSGLAIAGNGRFYTIGDAGRSLMTFPASGGDAPRRIALDPGKLNLANVEGMTLLPDGRHALVNLSVYTARGFAFQVGALDLQDGKVATLVEDAANGRYSRTGHLLFSRADTLLAARFDLGSMTLRGDAVPLAAGLRSNNMWSPAGFAFQATTAAFIPGSSAGRQRRFAWLEPNGSVKAWSDDRRPFVFQPVVSPDGRRVAAVIINSAALFEIWVSDVDRPALRRVVAFPDSDCYAPSWSPDGRQLLYARIAKSADDGVWVRDLATGVTRRVLRFGDVELIPQDWSPDGRWLIVTKYHRPSGLMLVHLPDGDDPARAVSVTPGPTASARFAPDGRRVAWVSGETGRLEVYLAPFADGKLGASMMISTAGGSGVVWAPDGRALYYLTLADQLVRVAFDRDGAPGTPAPAGNLGTLGETKQTGPAVFRDGRVLFLQRGDDETDARQLDLVVNMDRELIRRLP